MRRRGTRVIRAGRRRLPHPLHGARGRDAAFGGGRRRGRRPRADALDQLRRLVVSTGVVRSTRRRRRWRRRCAGTAAWPRSPEHEWTAIIELSPAGALTGLAKRALRGTPTVAVKPRRLRRGRLIAEGRPGMSTPPSARTRARPTPALLLRRGPQERNFVPNDDLVGPIDSSDEWIRQRTASSPAWREQGNGCHRPGLRSRARRPSRSPGSPRRHRRRDRRHHQQPKKTPSASRSSRDRIGANPRPPTTSTPRARACVRCGSGRRPRARGLAKHVVVVGAEKSATSSTDRSQHLVPPRRRRGRRGHRASDTRGSARPLGLDGSRRTPWG